MLPQLPTDNLYKFVTVLGASLVAIALGYYLAGTTALYKLEAELEAQLTTSELHSKLLSDSLTQAETNAERLPPAYVEHLRGQAAEQKKWVSDTRRNLMLFKSQKTHFDQLYYWLVAMGGVGLASFLFGTGLWYFNHQRYQDTIIRKQAGAIK